MPTSSSRSRLAYAIGYVLFGRLIDKLGARFGYSLAAAIWGIAAMAHAGAHATPVDFMIARFALGIGESGNFPAGVKAVAEWFPKKERAFAIGIFNAGANIGAILTPLIAPVLVLCFGWRAAFLVHRRPGVRLAGRLVDDLSPARARRRICAPPNSPISRAIRPTRPADVNWLPLAQAPPDLGLCGRQVHDRSDLVVLPVLAAGFLRRPSTAST